MDCDKILVLSEGALVEEGTHQELLNLGGVYSDMWQMQARFAPVFDAALLLFDSTSHSR
jgi:ABC-type transport system involved in cytochrome bd biosynthesis fused ATPase/permease subunit